MVGGIRVGKIAPLESGGFGVYGGNYRISSRSNHFSS